MVDYLDPRTEENAENFRELPLQNVNIEGFDPEENPDLCDMMSNRKEGTGERIFNLTELKDAIFTNCVKAESESQNAPSERGIRGISELMSKSLAALQVKLNLIENLSHSNHSVRIHSTKDSIGNENVHRWNQPTGGHVCCCP